MKSKIFILFASLLFSVAVFAQETKTIYLMKDGKAIHKVAVSDIDSIIFYKPELTEPDFVLINGVKWATHNVDAPGTFTANPEDVGMFYQWNRNAAYPSTGDITDWDSSTPEGNSWEKENDPSPAGYRLPTLAEIESLLDFEKVDTEKAVQNGVNGRIFTDIATGNSIFFPTTGGRDYSTGTIDIEVASAAGSYWSSTSNEGNFTAYYLGFGNSGAIKAVYPRSGGRAIRCVVE